MRKIVLTVLRFANLMFNIYCLINIIEYTKARNMVYTKILPQCRGFRFLYKNRKITGLLIVIVVIVYSAHTTLHKGMTREKDRLTTISAVVPSDEAKVSEMTREKYEVTSKLPEFVTSEDDAKRESFMCNETFNRTLEDNLKIIQNYPKGIADDYLWKIGGNITKPFRMKEFPVFVTAFNDRYYPQSQGLFRDLHQRFLMNPKYEKDVHTIVYDLGMTERQLKIVSKNCKCKIRRFPFEQFPPHVRNLKQYAFKPIIVQQLLMEHGFVWWMDTSVRFTTNHIDSAIAYAKEYSMLYRVTPGNRHKLSLAKQTNVKTFQYLGEDICKFKPFGEIWAGIVMFHYDYISRAVVQAWVTCALNSDCIAPPGCVLTCNMGLKYNGRCHRYDQSVLGIIARRLFHGQNVYPLDISLNDIYEIKWGDIVSYFESCDPVFRCYK